MSEQPLFYKRWWFTAFAVLVAMILISTLVSGGQTPGSTSTTLVGKAEAAVVTFVTDGDTIEVNHATGTDVAVRLIGINTPETDECFGPESKRALGQLIDGRKITMVGDVADMDDHLRLLRYIYLPDGTFVNGSWFAGDLHWQTSTHPTSRSQGPSEQLRSAHRVKTWDFGQKIPVANPSRRPS